MFSRCVQVVAYINTSFLFIAKLYSVVWIYHILCILSSFDPMIDYLQYTSLRNEKGEIAKDLTNISKLKDDTILY